MLSTRWVAGASRLSRLRLFTRTTTTTTATFSSFSNSLLLQSSLSSARSIQPQRRFLSFTPPPPPLRPVHITAEERAALRAARKERASRVLMQAQLGEGGEAATATISSSSSSASSSQSSTSWLTGSSRLHLSRYLWYIGLTVPTALVLWGVSDTNSPPAKLSQLLGVSQVVGKFVEEVSKPTYDKLLPDWSQIPNVPQDIPIPHTLVLDLEHTLVSSTWDRKYGWRHAKRPGVDQFLRTMAQYYEIVLYSPSIDGVADPVVTSLDKEGCIMHRLYRDATHYVNGVHVKDLNRLNRNVNRIIVIDDDPEQVQFHPHNVIRVKPYTDPTDRTDNTLARITPFLLEIAREGYSDIPALLQQYDGMDADEIAHEQERRVQDVRLDRERRSHRGLSGLATAHSSHLPAPELPASLVDVSSFVAAAPQQLTAKDIAGQAPPSTTTTATTEGLMGWLDRRAKEKEEHQLRKLEKWNQVILDKQRKRREAEQAASTAK